MKTNIISLIITGITIVLFFSTVFAGDSAKSIEMLAQNLPVEWKIQEIKKNVTPYWSLSESTCTEVLLVGPVKTGYRYFDKDGSLILEYLSCYEAINLWIEDDNFSDGWTILEIIKNRFNITPIERPSKLIDEEIKVYGLESLYAFDTTYSKESPPGTQTAKPKKLIRSWPNWRKDIERIIKSAQQINPAENQGGAL